MVEIKRVGNVFEAEGKNIILLSLDSYHPSDFNLSFLPGTKDSEKIIGHVIEVLIKRNSEPNQAVIIDKNSDIHFQCTQKTPTEQKLLLRNLSKEESKNDTNLVIGRVDEHLRIIESATKKRPDLLSFYENKLIRTETKIGNRYLCLGFNRSRNEIAIGLCGNSHAASDIGILPFRRVKIDNK